MRELKITGKEERNKQFKSERMEFSFLGKKKNIRRKHDILYLQGQTKKPLLYVREMYVAFSKNRKIKQFRFVYSSAKLGWMAYREFTVFLAKSKLNSPFFFVLKCIHVHTVS